MNGFSPSVIKVSSGDGRNFILLESFTYTAVNGQQITVPAGATSDGASTPRVLWREIPPFGPYWLAAFLHDYLYRVTARPKDECDALLLEAMLSLGVEVALAKTIFEGVHLCGWSSFDADRRPMPIESTQSTLGIAGASSPVGTIGVQISP